MNADQLLAHYDKVADSPDAVTSLRRFVLDLAVHGKLVEQDPADVPASELLKRIAAERNGRMESGEIRKGKTLAPSEAAPFEVPDGWACLRLGDTGNIFTGNSINAATRERLKKTETGRPFIATKDIGYGFDPIDYDTGLLVPASDDSFKIARAESVLICVEGGSAGRKIGIADRDICFGNKLLANDTWSVVSPRFVMFVYLSSFFFEQFSKRIMGVIGGISKRNFLQLPFSLPPLAEQHRIVTNLDELMVLCDRLEAARADREATRDRLAAASLARLNAPDPDPAVFQDHAMFALDNLGPLTTRPDQVDALRQTILNLAVRGKLVEQNPTDESATEVLNRLKNGAGDKARRKDSRVVRATKGEAAFECPDGWTWTTVQQTLDPYREISYGVIKLGHEPKSGGIPTLRCSDVRSGFIELAGVRNVHEEIEAKYTRTRLSGGEVVINIRGTLGGVALVPEKLEGFNVTREVAVVPIAKEISGPYMVYLMLSPYFWDHIQNNLRGIAYTGLNLGILRALPVPLPPLAEQHRIVAKVEELMGLCDQLKANLSNGGDTRRRLLNALLHHALMPTTDRAAA